MDSVYPWHKGEVKKAYDRHFSAYTAAMEACLGQVRGILEAEQIRFSIKSRIKSFSSYYKKLLSRNRKGRTEGNIQDILGVRIVSPFLEDVKRIESLLKENLPHTEVEYKGNEHSFREFGYQSLHLTVSIPEEILERFPDLDIGVFEIQVRTILQDAWSEVEHELVYKAGFTPYDESLRRKLAALNANLTLSDIIFQEIRDYQRRLHRELEKRRSSFIGQVAEALSDSPVSGPLPVPAPEPVPAPSPASTQTPASVTAPAPEGNRYVPDIPEQEPLASDSVDELLVKALVSHNKGDYAKALGYYNIILERDIERPVASVIFIHRGMALFGAAEYEAAANDFLQAADLDPQNPKAPYHLGVLYRVMERQEEAIEAFRKSLKINPYHLDTLLALSRTLAGGGDYPAALGFCEKALALEPEDDRAGELRSSLIQKMGM